MDGIAGIWSPGDSEIVKKTFLATGACQHRGKESAGMAVGNTKGIYIEKGLGRIGDVLWNQERLRELQDHNPAAAIGNTGYTKNSPPQKRNAEPIRIHPKKSSSYELVLTMDGYILEVTPLVSAMEGDYHFNTRNPTEVVGAILHQEISSKGISFDAGRSLLERLAGRGTFSLSALIHTKGSTCMITLNDESGFEPFRYGTIDDAFVACSESVSLRRLGGSHGKEFPGASMTISSPLGTEIKPIGPDLKMKDAFQLYYFGHVGSLYYDKQIFDGRRDAGKSLITTYGLQDGTMIIPNPDSGWGVTIGLYEGISEALKQAAFDYSAYDQGIIRVKDKHSHDRFMSLGTVYPALIKQAQAVRTFQEATKDNRYLQVGLKFGGIDSLLEGQIIDMGDDSIVRGSVSEGGSISVVKNAGAKGVNFWISYGPMIFPSFKSWKKGRKSIEELAVHRAFPGDHPYDKSLKDINSAVARTIGVRNVFYQDVDQVKQIAGVASYQALDASYPIAEQFWPAWLKTEIELFCKHDQANRFTSRNHL